MNRNPSAGFHFPATPVRIRWFMAVAWVLIAAKCLFVVWAVDHWRMPFHAAWVVAPTIVFAALASILWLTHQEE